MGARAGLIRNLAHVSWHENMGEAKSFGPKIVLTSDGQGVGSLYAVDLDGDRDLDILAADGRANKVFWIENLQPHPGDANRDGQFNSGDLVQVFVAGEYEDGFVGNSTWTGMATTNSTVVT